MRLPRPSSANPKASCAMVTTGTGEHYPRRLEAGHKFKWSNPSIRPIPCDSDASSQTYSLWAGIKSPVQGQSKFGSG